MRVTEPPSYPQINPRISTALAGGNQDTKLWVNIKVGPTITTVKYTLTKMTDIFNLLSAVGGVTALTFLVIYTILKPY